MKSDSQGPWGHFTRTFDVGVRKPRGSAQAEDSECRLSAIREAARMCLLHLLTEYWQVWWCSFFSDHSAQSPIIPCKMMQTLILWKIICALIVYPNITVALCLMAHCWLFFWACLGQRVWVSQSQAQIWEWKVSTAVGTAPSQLWRGTLQQSNWPPVNASKYVFF